MKVLLDCSPKKIKEYSKKYNFIFGQLRTPLTNYRLSGSLYAIDNGCFSSFKKDAWMRLIQEAKQQSVADQPVFVCAPDIVCDARRTLELFDIFYDVISPLKCCLVLQDGIGQFDIDWKKVEAVFVGGSDAFKVSQEAMAAAKTAKILGKWVHVGRVNTFDRLKQWIDVADSIDGSGISRFDHMLDDVMRLILSEDKQLKLLEHAS